MTPEEKLIRDNKVKKLEQAKAALQIYDARIKTRIRKMDTKRKIILGGALIARAKHNPALAQEIEDIIKNIDPEKQRANALAFDGWTLKDEDNG